MGTQEKNFVFDVELPLFEQAHGRVRCLQCVWGALVAAETKDDVDAALMELATTHTKQRHSWDSVPETGIATMTELIERVEHLLDNVWNT